MVVIDKWMCGTGQAPPQDSWNGELLGYVVTWRGASRDNTTRALTAAGWGTSRALLPALRPHALYEVRVRAFNKVGAGPPAALNTATTLEGGTYCILTPTAAYLYIYYIIRRRADKTFLLEKY